MASDPTRAQEHASRPLERLRRRADFAACYDRGKRHYSEHFLVFSLAGVLPDAKTRLGLSVSRKVGGAVTRNRIKRLLREFFRLHAGTLPQKTDVVAVVKRNTGCSGLDFAQVNAEMEPLLRRMARDGT
ncbi:MAG: ribonuclease P protein component [Desulfovibrio sp.]|jgi:ribonuclease P protein component|nr:ribonuclease P protein component [Desulfovibrio sp.]